MKNDSRFGSLIVSLDGSLNDDCLSHISIRVYNFFPVESYGIGGAFSARRVNTWAIRDSSSVRASPEDSAVATVSLALYVSA